MAKPDVKKLLISGALSPLAAAEAQALTIRSQTPFYQNAEGHVVFEEQSGRAIMWGHSYTPSTGYCVCVRFEDSQRSNDFPAETARQLAKLMFEKPTPAHSRIQRTLQKLALAADKFNKAWVAAGKPAEGVIMPVTKGRA